MIKKKNHKISLNDFNICVFWTFVRAIKNIAIISSHGNIVLPSKGYMKYLQSKIMQIAALSLIYSKKKAAAFFQVSGKNT